MNRSQIYNKLIEFQIDFKRIPEHFNSFAGIAQQDFERPDAIVQGLQFEMRLEQQWFQVMFAGRMLKVELVQYIDAGQEPMGLIRCTTPSIKQPGQDVLLDEIRFNSRGQSDHRPEGSESEEGISISADIPASYLVLLFVWKCLQSIE